EPRAHGANSFREVLVDTRTNRLRDSEQQLCIVGVWVQLRSDKHRRAFAPKSAPDFPAALEPRALVVMKEFVVEERALRSWRVKAGDLVGAEDEIDCAIHVARAAIHLAKRVDQVDVAE